MPKMNPTNRYNQGNIYGPRNDQRVKNNCQAQVYTDAQSKQLPENFVDEAMNVMVGLLDHDRRKFDITTSKIRNILGMVIGIYNEEYARTDEELKPESVAAIQMARIGMIYEAGRDDKVKNFVERSKLIAYLKDIGTSREKLIRFTQYLEALVAYHKYLGGKEN